MRVPPPKAQMAPPPRFIADAMLGSLARKLRIFGYDTEYFKEGGDERLEALARTEGRTILTSDRSLFDHSRSKGIQAILVVEPNDRARLASVLIQSGQSTTNLGKSLQSRCAVCNGELRILGRKEAGEEGAPPKVIARHRQFFLCTSCSRLYWRGRHWERLRRLLPSLKTKA